jgi:hypothetical protein
MGSKEGKKCLPLFFFEKGAPIAKQEIGRIYLFTSE